MYDITALGELLIDFTESGFSSAGMKLFEQNPGGAAANVLAAMAKLGEKTAFIGKVGKDMHGEFLKKTLDSVGIDTTGLVMSEDYFTTLAFVALSPNGERMFSFARKPGADTRLTTQEVSESVLKATQILHVGSLSLTDEPARSATQYAVRTVKAQGKIVSYDPNYRKSLWENEATAKKHMRSLLPYVDVMKLSDEETELLTDEASPEKAARYLNDLGISCVAVTLGKKGALVSIGGECEFVAGYPKPAIDTTGAGDAFWGGFLHKMIQMNKIPEQMSIDEAAICADWGNAVATCCVQKRGAIPAMPTLEDVKVLMAEKKILAM